MKRIFTLTIFCFFATVAQAQNFDTTGLSQWPVLSNSYNSWMTGAFDSNKDTSDPADFGWGYYDVTSHLIEGDSIYIIKTYSEDYKAISIDNISSGVYTVSISNLDGSSKTVKTFNRSPYGTKNFFYYDIAGDQVKDLEPATSSWDIVFRRYLIFFPGYGGYPVAGVLHNRGVETSQVEFAPGGSASVNDTAQFAMDGNISTIGYDWKTAGPGGTVIHDTLVYYVKDQAGNVNELRFTGYGGSANGKMVFEVNGDADSVELGAGNSDQVYYSLENGTEVSSNQDNLWDIAFFAQSSFSAIPVRINDVNGVELYRYPKANITYWNSVGLEEERKLNVISAYPNPANNVINVAVQSESGGDLSLKLFDLSGRVLKSEDIPTNGGLNEPRLNVSNLPAGSYILQVSGSGVKATTPILIN